MLRSKNFYIIILIQILIMWLISVCCGFVLLSSAAGLEDLDLFLPGQAWTYDLHSTVLLNDNDENSKNVGFYISGEVLVEAIWGESQDRIVRINLRSPTLYIRSRKAPTPDGFVPHKSKLDEFIQKPFYVYINNGKIEEIHLPVEEPVGLANLKKGIASLFQFQLSNTEVSETDASGTCSVTYTTLSQNKFRKVKKNCLSPNLLYLKRDNVFLNTNIKSFRAVDYELDPSNEYFKRIAHKETHEVHLSTHRELGNFIEVDQILEYKNSDKTETMSGTLDEIIKRISRTQGSYSSQSLITHREEENDDIKTFSAAVDDLRSNLDSESLGSVNSAKAFIKLVSIARMASKEDIAKTLGSKKNKKILPQLYDILGNVQTLDSHEAAIKKLHFDKEDVIDLTERYLWALSMHSYPNLDIAEDLLKRYKKSTNIPDKVKETLILTLAGMANKFRNSAQKKYAAKVVQDIEESILNGLDYAKKEERLVFLRALRNLKSETTISTLIKVIRNGTSKEGAVAWKALSSFDPKFMNNEVLKTARRSFLQIDRKYDSSSRTISVDVLLQSNPNEETLGEIIDYLKSNDTAYEIKQYVLQRLQMFSAKNPEFGKKVDRLMMINPKIYNYATLNPGGLSLSLERNFAALPLMNGSLTTVQEILNKVVKRGNINVVFDKNGITEEYYSIGLFASGLGSFMSSGEEVEEGEEEAVTAGMDLTVLGTQIRPFVFFNGQGELMGHVWSGTASDRTPAYQALVMLHDHLEYLRLGTGFIAEIDVKGAASLDLAGKIELSIWNRNAQAVVEKAAGIAVVGITKVDSSFVKSQAEFTASIDPKLVFEIDIDFAGNVKFCLRLTQFDASYSHNIFKIERIPGSKHKLRIAKYKKFNVPGITYSLNKKNNEMCNEIFS